jgi:hypothetical protein
MFVQELAHHPDLSETVLFGNDRKDGLIEASAEELHLAPAGHLFDQLPAFFLFGLHKLPKRTGKMESEFDRRMFDHFLKKRHIAILKGSLEDEPEIPHGLMIMDGQQKSEVIHR